MSKSDAGPGRFPYINDFKNSWYLEHGYLEYPAFMVPNPNFTPLISKCSKISGLFNIPGFFTSPINTRSHLHPI
jgi:hypothetical protein